MAELSKASGRDAANDAYEAILDRKGDIVIAIFRTPAETFADLLIQAKVGELEGYTKDDSDPEFDDSYCPNWIGKALFRSIRRLAEREEGNINV